jgi:hypothetical protein
MLSLLAEIGRYSLRLAPVLFAFGIVIDLLWHWVGHFFFIGQMLGLILVSYLAHRVVLFDLRFTKWGKLEAPQGIAVPPEAMGRFLVVSLVELFAVLIVAFFVVAVFSEIMPNLNVLFWVTTISMSMVSWVFLTFLGTLYPAAASHEFPSFGRALSAGRKTSSSVAWQLLLLPVLYGFAVTTVIMSGIPSVLSTKLWDPVSIAFDALLIAAESVQQVMIAVILTRAYRQAW